VLIRFVNENPRRESEKFHKFFTVHELYVTPTDTVIDKKMSLHGIQFCKMETTLIVTVLGELVSKLLSCILSSKTRSWRPEI
jgi:hypothetical protein